VVGAIGPHGPGVGGPRVRLVPGALDVAERAARCPDWPSLVAAAGRCTACDELAATRTTVVVGDVPPWAAEPAGAAAAGGGPGGGTAGAGPGGGTAGRGPAGAAGAGGGRLPRPRLAIVGEAPGADEDAAGRPFVGRAGRLLDEMLVEAGLDRAELAVLNTLQCRPPGNRTPKPAELARCHGWLDRKLELLDPPLILALGRTAAAWFLGNSISLAGVRGQVHEVRGRRVVATYHPSAAIRFGPAGAPRLGLREDLEFVAGLTGVGG
jgi:uracil-DNA glycosylase